MAQSKCIKSKTELNGIVSSNPSGHSASSAKVMSQARIIKNLVVVCLLFFFLFSAYQALANLQSTLNIEGNLGIISQSVVYIALIVSSLFLPKLIIKKLGCKLTLFFSVLTYAPYVAANFYPHLGTFIPTAVLIGFGAAPLWSAKCTYINEISTLYSSYSSDSVDVITSKFFGVFFMIFQNTQIWGNLVSFFVLRPSHTLNDIEAVNQSSHSTNATCGITFSNGTSENLEPPPEAKRYVLISIFLGCVVLAAIIVGVFLDPLDRKEEKKDEESALSRVAATLKHLMKPQQMLLVPLTIFSGLEQAFILGDYTKAYVACAFGIYNVGLVFICFGVVNAIMSFLAGRVVKFVSRKIVMLIGAAGNVGVCIVLFLWEPQDTQLIYAFILVGVWGLSDAIWQTQINALYGVLFRSEEEAAFANYRLWESLGFALAFAYSSVLSLTYKISILLAFLVTGIIGYIAVEVRTSRRDSYTVNSTV